MSKTAYNLLPTVQVLYKKFAEESYTPTVFATTSRTFAPDLFKKHDQIEYKATVPAIVSEFKLDPLFLIRT